MLAYADTAPELADATLDAGQGDDLLMQMARCHGDCSHLLDGDKLTVLGMDVVQDWERDLATIGTWRTKTERAIASAAQDDPMDKTFPWVGASNIKYPFLTIAAEQFAARAYPAIVKGDRAIGVEVVGEKPEQPEVPPIPPEAQRDPKLMQAMQGAVQKLMAQFQERQQRYKAKEARAKRVETYLNYKILEDMDDWEGEMDTLLNHIPVTGMAFKKVFYNGEEGRTVSEYVHALHLTVSDSTKSLKTCPRITHDYERYPYEIARLQKQGVFRDVVLVATNEDGEAPRVLLEQHRLDDLDGDGIAEPYIVTVDKETSEVLRLEAAFGEEDIRYADQSTARPAEQHGWTGRGGKADPYAGTGAAGAEGGELGELGAGLRGDISDPSGRTDLGEARRVVAIDRLVPFVKYPFLRDPKGRFYEIGFGHLLEPLSDVIDTAINQLNDAATMQNAPSGFLGSGVKLPGAASAGYQFVEPGKWKTVNVPGNDLRAAMVPFPMPAPSPITFQLLELMMGAAKEVASVKDVLTGDAPTTAPVGTTQMLIEQGLQSFTAIYKRIYRALKEEFRLIYECERRYGSQEEYAEVLDDPDADFKADFAKEGRDIVPVSDPTVVTKMQSIAKAQMRLQIAESPIGMQAGLNPRDIVTELYEAADLGSPSFVQNPQPPPELAAKVGLMNAQAELAQAQAKKLGVDMIAAHSTAQETEARTGKLQAETDQTRVNTIALHGSTVEAEARARLHDANAMNTHADTLIKAGVIRDPTQGPDAGGVSGMAGEPGQPMGNGGAPADLGQAAGGLAGDVMGGGQPGPDEAGGAA